MEMMYDNRNGWTPENGYDIQMKRSLRRDSNFAGIISISQAILLQLSFPLLFLELRLAGLIKVGADEYYGLGIVGFLLVYAAAYMIGMGIPAPVCAAIAGRKINPFARMHSESEQGNLRFSSIVLALLAGLSVCILANFASSYVVYIFSQFGLYPPEMPSYMDKTISSLALNIFVFALLPALLEEMIFRGFILRILRGYGDVFAMLISSAMFALMHGNILQIPFAFIVGMVCAYLAVKTGRIWISMMLHFLNNFMSVLLQYAGLYSASREQNQMTVLVVFSIVGMIGLISLLILFAVSDPLVRKIKPVRQGLSAGQRVAALLLTPGMIISIILSLALTAYTTRFGGAS